MRILDQDHDKSVDQVILLLTRTEAQQALSYIQFLLDSDRKEEHIHLSNEDYQKDITIAIYVYPSHNYFPFVSSHTSLILHRFLKPLPHE